MTVQVDCRAALAVTELWQLLPTSQIRLNLAARNRSFLACFICSAKFGRYLVTVHSSRNDG